MAQLLIVRADTSSIVVNPSGVAISDTGVFSGFSGSGTSLTFPGTLSIAAGKTLTASNTLTFLGTDGASLTIGNGGTLGTSAYVVLASGVGAWMTAPTSAGLLAITGDATGTGALVFANAPVLVGPNLGTPTSGTLTNCTGYPVASLANLGTGVGTALVINVGSAGAFITFNGALGTPSSGTATNLTGTASGLTAGTASAVAVGGITGLGTSVATFLATPSSANLAAALTDETGSGANVFANTPTLVTPVLGAATGTSVALSGNFTTTGGAVAANTSGWDACMGGFPGAESTLAAIWFVSAFGSRGADYALMGDSSGNTYLNAPSATLTFRLNNSTVGTLTGTSFSLTVATIPPSLADSAAPNSSIYYSTDAAKLVFKDSGGVVRALY